MDRYDDCIPAGQRIVYLFTEYMDLFRTVAPFRPIEPSDGWDQSFRAKMPADDRLGGHPCMAGPYIP
jgi:hypothetical protein